MRSAPASRAGYLRGPPGISSARPVVPGFGCRIRKRSSTQVRSQHAVHAGFAH
jgi:hypothetical protein